MIVYRRMAFDQNIETSFRDRNCLLRHAGANNRLPGLVTRLVGAGCRMCLAHPTTTLVMGRLLCPDSAMW